MTVRPDSDGYFVVLLGPDGAGKTTVMKRMQPLASEWTFTSLQPEDLYPIEGLECYDWALRTHPREYVKNMSPLTRATFFAHIVSIDWEYHIQPALAEGRVVLCDSYWYRTVVKEFLQNPTAAPVLARLTSLLPAPDLVVWLEVPLEEAWRRNGVPSVFEVGGGRPSAESFASFQQRVLDRLHEEVADLPQVTLDALMPPDDVARAAVQQIRHLSAGRRTAAHVAAPGVAAPGVAAPRPAGR